jgi:hypothetical protein
VTWAPRNPGDPCHLGTTTATGSFRTNGIGGTVRYEWVRTDSTGTVYIAEPNIVIAAGDTSVHSVVTDSWAPQSSGTEQLVFISPVASAPLGSWSCNGH